MDLFNKIKQDLKKATEQASDSLNILRDLLSALHNKEIELRPKKQELTDEIVIQVIKQQVKRCKEAIEMFEKGDRKDLVEKENKELEVLSQYLPEELSDEKIKQAIVNIIEKTGASNMQDFGKVMGHVMKELKGRADGNKVKKILEQELSKS